MEQLNLHTIHLNRKGIFYILRELTQLLLNQEQVLFSLVIEQDLLLLLHSIESTFVDYSLQLRKQLEEQQKINYLNSMTLLQDQVS